MRVLLSDTWAGGGGSTFVSVLARALHGRGHVVDVVLGYRSSPAVDAYRDVVEQIFVPPYSFSSVVLRGAYDAIHITEADLRPPFDYARRVRRLGLRAPVIVTSHTAQEGVHIPGGGDVLVFVSEHGRTEARFDAPRAAVIPNGVDPAWLATRADETLVLDVTSPLAVWTGRLVENPPQKDFLGFGYAIHALLQAGWEVLVLDGSPPCVVDPAEAQLRRWFGDSVRYANQARPEQALGALRRAAHTGGAYVSTSRVEGAPFIALEALALGCPVIAPRIAGYQPLAEAGVVSSYDSLNQLIELMSTGAFRSTPTRLPEQLTAAAMSETYLELYASVSKARRAGVTALARRAGVKAAQRPRIRTLTEALRR